ncbi:rhomboid family intramembrane serine protease [Coraliomargarita akajimensis]|uniref:Rhomboid family protein n=1 Tax=Coraliomargarita akajimensis (strain DSM 45221 / IAM 15411 / JCM 23193 / KCTC 12865 / 04OKA010-24) TaxID=583355 RepID=D5EQ04_CORAD|nr:rhomboid family intramembrane serine protease [Coraliomargarita akajimensis]ADE55737.1 Rhomboid family protein [Coraliomargarita akajimensis DSM 45221]
MPPKLKVLHETWPLILIFLLCGLTFAVDVFTPAGAIPITDPWLLVPAEVSAAAKGLLAGSVDAASLRTLSTLLSHAFLHGGIEHIVLNLIFIWIFGVLVLRELGIRWFFLTFILTAITGGIGQTLLDPESIIPVLGASGALMGLEGIYLGMALRWRLPNPDVWPIARPVPQERLMLLAVFGIILDLFGIVGQEGGIAFGAHIGGFLGGLFLGTLLIPRPRNAR